MQNNKNLRQEIVQDIKVGSKFNLMEQDYHVIIIMQCNWEITSYFTVADGEVKLDPPIGRTCADGISKEECENQKAYKILLTVKCNTPEFGFLCNFRHPATGKLGSSNTPHIVTPRCVEGEIGQTFLFKIPDPT